MCANITVTFELKMNEWGWIITRTYIHLVQDLQTWQKNSCLLNKMMFFSVVTQKLVCDQVPGFWWSSANSGPAPPLLSNFLWYSKICIKCALSGINGLSNGKQSMYYTLLNNRRNYNYYLLVHEDNTIHHVGEDAKYVIYIYVSSLFKNCIEKFLSDGGIPLTFDPCVKINKET